ncbi:glycoside hydrolase family 19 protein [Bradyrhizobium sp. PMVTL-01]|uniref:glycoside hydrolase family 19 protein n=1 Tax=Bradyrhizobium sp. PMVTL-01 TaxID=3434999 RepID=UPI003F6EDB4A
MLTREILRKMWPHAPQAKIDAICSIAAEEFAYHGITETRVVVQLMANVSHENGAGTIIRENGNYSAQRILQVFGVGKSSARVTEEEAQKLAHNPRALFERVYNLPHSPKLAKDLGNKQPGDGYKYRGGGDLQLTGRGNYERIGELTGHTEIILNPDALADPVISFRVAVAEFVNLRCVPWAKQGNTKKVRALVNGGSNGLAEVEVWVRKWEEALPGVTPAPLAPRGSDTDKAKTITSSNIIRGAVGTVASLATGEGARQASQANVETTTTAISAVADKLQQANDTLQTVSVAKDNATAIIHTVKPFLGLAPESWQTIAAIAVTMAVCCVGFIIYERWQKIHQEGR